MNDVSEVTAIVEDHVQGLATGESRESLLDTPVVLLLGLTFPGEDGDTSGGNAARVLDSS